MALLHNKCVAVKGISACVPKNIVRNIDNLIFPENDINAFIGNIGVEEFRVSGDDICTSDLGVAAAEKLMDELQIDRMEIGILVFVSQTPDFHFLPNTACIIQDRLKLSTESLAFDVPLGCSGYVYGLSIISSYLSSGQIKKGLLIVGDTASKTTSKKDKSSAMLFGDAGAATILEYDEQAEGIYFHLATDGNGYKAIIVPDGGFRNPFSATSLVERSNEQGLIRNSVNLHLDGLDVFSFGISEAPKTCRKIMEYLNIINDDIDYAIFHQANKMMNEKIRKKLSLPENKVPYSLKHFGNTSSASIPLTMVTEMRTDLQQKTNRLLLCGFGVGLSWGTAYGTFSNIVVPELIEM
ncbi:ketoacyl-ACP synthase III [Agriterribacter sp.]|uniref:3-oxoacyl-ACP synthase III family protein n=1 Tax=Agriterribacter sp. TaxID=2821509 RepID=UPI002C8ADD4B|nr:ketoacyl-ACP synthase III [Agriterribacter sp.]HRO48269.1 ketoacyl-ACP synthase III [Agriterribacter sp.]HRQ18090.1 ketoacyl-ACP synthase III [Agriterribacter sp.]